MEREGGGWREREKGGGEGGREDGEEGVLPRLQLILVGGVVRPLVLRALDLGLQRLPLVGVEAVQHVLQVANLLEILVVLEAHVAQVHDHLQAVLRDVRDEVRAQGEEAVEEAHRRQLDALVLGNQAKVRDRQGPEALPRGCLQQGASLIQGLHARAPGLVVRRILEIDFEVHAHAKGL
eukprot:5260230-Pyramimonas_sp.AAC.1